eukprot:3660737-Lingulodinium_polyedra.AAC.1
MEVRRRWRSRFADLLKGEDVTFEELAERVQSRAATDFAAAAAGPDLALFPTERETATALRTLAADKAC